jgi:hypothetical protein
MDMGLGERSARDDRVEVADGQAHITAPVGGARVGLLVPLGTPDNGPDRDQMNRFRSRFATPGRSAAEIEIESRAAFRRSYGRDPVGSPPVDWSNSPLP